MDANYDNQGYIDDDERDAESYPERMLKKCQADFANAKTFLNKFHTICVAAYEWYHNAQQYDSLKVKSRFPVPFFQQQIDTFAAYILDKLFYKNRPCTVVGREDTDKGDASAKQDMMAYQDDQDRIYHKLDLFARDCAMYRVGIAQVDYENRTERRLVGSEEPILMADEYGEPQPVLDPLTQEPATRSRVVAEDVPIYRGAKVKRVDPLDFFITQDKENMSDGYPVMIRSRKPLEDFKDPIYINYDKLKTQHRGVAEDGLSIHNKRMVHGLEPEQTAHKRNSEYIEWQGEVNKFDLYEYLGKPTEMEIEGVPTVLVGPDDKTTAIFGWVGEVLVRIEETPFETKRPNVIVGIIQGDEGELIGTSLADKLGAVTQGMEVLMGILLENFKQTVNAGHIIKKNALVKGSSTLVNEPGWVLETNEDVNNVHKRIDQQRVAPDIYQLLQDYFPQMGQDASGLQNILSGTGEPSVDTLGENEMVAATASMRMNSYLRTFETTFVEPLYQLRNQINMQFLNNPYIYKVIGENAIEWRTIEPGQIRANVDFVCESSSRETNRLVITQQFIQTMKMMPGVKETGFPVRVDKMLGDLMERGFSMSADKINEYLPSLKLEEAGMDIDQLLIDNMLFHLRMQGPMGLMVGANGPPGGNTPMGGPSPQPRNEGEARQSLRGSNQTQPGRTE